MEKQSMVIQAVMKQTIFILIVLILLIPEVSAIDDYPFSLGLGSGLTTLKSGEKPLFTSAPLLNLRFTAYLKSNWLLEFGCSSFRVYDDLSATSSYRISTNSLNRTRTWQGFDFGLLFKRRWFPTGNRFALTGGLGLGLSNWRMADPESGKTLKTLSEKGDSTDYSATEIFLTGASGIESRFRDRWKIGMDFIAHFLTGAGREFSSTVEDNLGKWNLKFGVTLSYLFGGKNHKKLWAPVRITTGEYGKVIKRGTAQTYMTEIFQSASGNDSDNDGVPDNEDYCPGTPGGAIGLVNMQGCPIDSDMDGIPDYRDMCPYYGRGLAVNKQGCPLDNDNDGVPDGIDECPDTNPGFKVDRFGCIDFVVFEQPITLNIRYPSSSFEIDPRNKQRLDSIAQVLKQIPVIMIEINGYTDNLSSAKTNRKLAQKRANRVRDYLVSQGINTDRLTPIGRGSINFIASNNSEKDRQKNRRVELRFFQVNGS